MTVSSDRIVKNDIDKEVRINNYFVNLSWKKSMGKEGDRKPTKSENRFIITLQLKYECPYRMCKLIWNAKQYRRTCQNFFLTGCVIKTNEFAFRQSLLKLFQKVLLRREMDMLLFFKH